MPPPTVQVVCPRYPEHGMTSKRWLTPDEWEMFAKDEQSDDFAANTSIAKSGKIKTVSSSTK